MSAMARQFKLMILVNVLLGFFFVVFNLIYDNMPSHYALWSPLWLTFLNSMKVAQFGMDIGLQEPNFSFYFFWAVLLVNVYFIVRLGRSKETKQNTA
jgi:hypothetical protein